MLPYRHSPLLQIALVVFFIVMALYAAYQARGVVLGPQITLENSVSEVHDAYIMIKGGTEHIAELRINGNPTAVGEDGAFAQPYLLASGVNRIMFDARDKYGKTKHRETTILYTPVISMMSATSSATSTSYVQ
jgi:hypothetical protein